MANKRNKRTTKQAVYVRRRRFLLVLFLLALAMIVFAFFRVADVFSSPDDPATQTQLSSTMEDEPSSESESSVEQSSEPESSAEEPAESSDDESAAEVSKAETGAASNSANDSGWNLILVNENNALPEGYAPTLETLEDGYQVDTRIADAVRTMYTQARTDGIVLTTCSAYRSVERQQENYDRQIQTYLNQGDTQADAEAKTAAYYATPGYSEHHTGLALDIVTPSYQSLDDGYANTLAAKWLRENAHLYGFVLRYPEDKEEITGINFEPWHYRYVGVEHAAAMNEGNYCLEEYVNVILAQQLEDIQQTIDNNA